MAKNDDIRCLALDETEGEEFAGVGSYAFMAYAAQNGDWPYAVASTIVSVGATLNSRTYRGDGATAPAPQSGNEVFLVTSGGAASKFQTSTGSAAYVDATVAAALGATGKFLGNITGAESGSSAVVSNATAKAYFDADPTRYVSTNTYYFFDGTDLKTVTYAVVTVTLSIESLNPAEAGIWIPLLTFTAGGTRDQGLCEPGVYKVTATGIGVQVYRLKKSDFILGLRESS